MQPLVTDNCSTGAWWHTTNLFINQSFLVLDSYLAEEERLRGQALSQKETEWAEVAWTDGSVGKVSSAQTQGPVLDSGTHEKSQWQCLCWGGTRGHLALAGQ